MKIAVAGLPGRMGKELIKAVNGSPNLVLCGALSSPGNMVVNSDAGIVSGIGNIGISISDDCKKTLENVDGLIDFTTPKSSLVYSKLAMKYKFVHMIGTTGFTNDQMNELSKSAKQSRTIISPNTSLGANILIEMAKYASTKLGNNFKVDIIEKHHKEKIDSPSGTAKSIKNSILSENISIKSYREDAIIGTHKVIFSNLFEELSFEHTIKDRSVFAQGAINAIYWGNTKENGIHSILDMIKYNE